MKIEPIAVASPLLHKKLCKKHENDSDRDILRRWNKVMIKGKQKGDRR